MRPLLKLGLEDLIPLPKHWVTGDDDVRAAVGGDPSTNQVAHALVDLLRLGRLSQQPSDIRHSFIAIPPEGDK